MFYFTKYSLQPKVATTFLKNFSEKLMSILKPDIELKLNKRSIINERRINPNNI